MRARRLLGLVGLSLVCFAAGAGLLLAAKVGADRQDAWCHAHPTVAAASGCAGAVPSGGGR